MTEKEALTRAMQLCSKKEYCSGDIRQKLAGWEVNPELTDKIIETLIREKFIDDERYATAFANDKLKFSKWGKVKIGFMLKQKGVAVEIVSSVLSSIANELYAEVLQSELKKKARSLKANSDYEFKGKLVQFAVSRGFEYDLAGKLVEELIKRG